MENKELRDLKTHVNGSTNSHETRNLDHKVQLNPTHSNPSEYDNTEDKYKNNFNSSSEK